MMYNSKAYWSLRFSPEVLSQSIEDDEGESNANREEEITRKFEWKNKSLHSLDNLIPPLDLGIHTRFKTRNMVAY